MFLDYLSISFFRGGADQDNWYFKGEARVLIGNKTILFQPSQEVCRKIEALLVEEAKL